MSATGDGSERAGVTASAGRWPGSRPSPLLASVGKSGDGSGPYASAFGRLASAGYAVVDGFIVRAVGADRDDPAGLDGIGREEIATQLGALELRRGQRLGAGSDSLRLAVSSLPRAIEVPILGAPGVAPDPSIAGDLRSVEELIAALRAAAAAFGRRAIVVTAVPDAETIELAGTLVTRDPRTGTIETPSRWIAPVDGEAADAPQRRGLRSQCDHIAAAAEAACGDMCHVSIAVIDGVPVITGIAPAPRSPHAALRVAVDLRDHGLIPSVEALRRVPLSLFTPDVADTVPSTASTDVSRLLAWADEGPSLPILPSDDVALPRVRDVADVAALDRSTAAAMLVPSGGREEVAGRLHQVAELLAARDIDRVMLVLNQSLRDAAPTALPALPWQAVVGTPDDPAARILAAGLGRTAS